MKMEMPPGRVVSVGDRSLIVDHELGQGMMAVSYAIRCRESGRPYALKRARARFDLFRQILAAEAEASRRLPELVGLPTARVVAADEESLLSSPQGPGRDPRARQWDRGKWVALVGSKAVAAAETWAEVLETLSAKAFPKRPPVHRLVDG